MYELIDYIPQTIQAVLPLMAAMAIGSAGIGLGKSIFGGIQALKGGRDYRRLSKQAPQYDVQPPEYFQDLLNMYNRQAPSRAPGSEMEEERVDVDLAEAARRMEEVDDTRGILGGLQEAYATSQARKRDIGKTDAEYAAAERARLEKGREGVMRYGVGLETSLAQEKFGYEVSEWDRRMNEATERRKAGWQNVFSGLESGLSAATSYASNKELLDILRKSGGGAKDILSNKEWIDKTFDF